MQRSVIAPEAKLASGRTPRTDGEGGLGRTTASNLRPSRYRNRGSGPACGKPQGPHSERLVTVPPALSTPQGIPSWRLPSQGRLTYLFRIPERQGPPRSRGGATTISNCVAARGRCDNHEHAILARPVAPDPLTLRITNRFTITCATRSLPESPPDALLFRALNIQSRVTAKKAGCRKPSMAPAGVPSPTTEAPGDFGPGGG